MAVKVAAGKVNAVNGEPWTNELDFACQDYVEVPGQPWLDGFCVGEGRVRQFVAMPLGQGYTAEEQITGTAEHGGIQLLVRPLKRQVWERRLERQRKMRARWAAEDVLMDACAAPVRRHGSRSWRQHPPADQRGGGAARRLGSGRPLALLRAHRRTRWPGAP